MADPPQWVSVVEGLGGALGAVSAAGVAALALVLQRRSNREERDRQARQQQEDRDAMRAAARIERIWEQRSDVYLDILQALQPEAGSSATEKLQRMYDAAWPLRSRVHAFGSRDVVDAFGDFINATREQLSRDPGTPVETDQVEETRKQLRMAIRISNGVDYADDFESRGPSPFAVPEHFANPVWSAWQPPPDVPGYPAARPPDPPMSPPAPPPPAP